MEVSRVSARVRDVIGVISDPGPGNGVNGS